MLLTHNYLIIWELLTFAALLLVLRAYAWKPTMEALQTRENSIRISLQKAEDARTEAENNLAESKKSRTMMQHTAENLINQAKELAEKIRVEAVSRADAERRTILKKTQEEIEHSKELATIEIHASLAELVVKAAGIILADAIDESHQKNLIDAALFNLSLSSSDRPFSDLEKVRQGN